MQRHAIVSTKHMSYSSDQASYSHRHAQLASQVRILKLLPLDSKDREASVPPVALDVLDEVKDYWRWNDETNVLCILVLQGLKSYSNAEALRRKMGKPRVKI